VTVEGRRVQVPSAVAPAAALQAWQSLGLVPPQAVSQQTPSAQKEEAQSEGAEQGAPVGERVNSGQVSE
jgi:hypothetical protein